VTASERRSQLEVGELGQGLWFLCGEAPTFEPWVGLVTRRGAASGARPLQGNLAIARNGNDSGQPPSRGAGPDVRGWSSMEFCSSSYRLFT
jgi:hypothetical protein